MVTLDRFAKNKGNNIGVPMHIKKKRSAAEWLKYKEKRPSYLAMLAIEIDRIGMLAVVATEDLQEATSQIGGKSVKLHQLLQMWRAAALIQEHCSRKSIQDGVFTTIREPKV